MLLVRPIGNFRFFLFVNGESIFFDISVRNNLFIITHINMNPICMLVRCLSLNEYTARHCLHCLQLKIAFRSQVTKGHEKGIRT